MDDGALERAKERLAAAEVEAALLGARGAMAALADAAGELEATLPLRVGDAVRDGLRVEALPVARQVAELRGLLNGVLRRLDRIEADVRAERQARVDDLALLVDLVASGWSGVDARLAKLEKAVGADGAAVVYRIEERRSVADAG